MQFLGGVRTFRRQPLVRFDTYNCIKVAFHDTDTDILGDILARMCEQTDRQTDRQTRSSQYSAQFTIPITFTLPLNPYVAIAGGGYFTPP